MAERDTKTVYVAMSGGVDSSVAAALLKERGYAVRGIFIRTWQPDFLPCTWREERSDATRVAAMLGIPFETIDLSEEYRKSVVDYMIDEYRRGQTPNPDIVCNKRIKFGSFFRYALQDGADFIATGHYARVKASTNNGGLRTHNLYTGMDSNKDQSYFLWTLPQEVLRKTLFPIGDYTKQEVRELAKKFNLHVAEKKDSQGVCFLGKIDLEEFLSHYIPAHPGVVVNTNGAPIGEHSGVRYYTLGQRHGFDVRVKSPTDGAHYVVAKDIPSNTLMVSGDTSVREAYGAKEIYLENVHWIGMEPDPNKKYDARIRYRQPLQKSLVEKTTKSGGWKVVFDAVQKAATPGQSCVLYDGEICLGGGVIKEQGTIGRE